MNMKQEVNERSEVKTGKEKKTNRQEGEKDQTKRLKERVRQEIKEFARKEFERKIEGIRQFAAKHPDHDFTKANQDVVKEVKGTWHCVGALEMAGFVYWELALAADFTPPIYFFFTATGGPDWAFSAFVGDFFGSWVVPPESLVDGEYRFSLSQAGAGVGGFNIDFFTMDKRFLGTCTGVAAGGGIVALSGIGSISH